jgi:hypothetical protein
MLYMMLGKTGLRSTRLDLGLPIEAGRLWASHLLATFITGTATFAFLLALTLMTMGGLADLGESSVFPRADFLRTSAFLYGGLLLAGVLLTRPQPDQRSIRLGRPAIIMTSLLMIVLGTIAYALSFLPLAAAIILPALAVSLAWRQRVNLPESLSLAPKLADESPALSHDSETLHYRRESQSTLTWKIYTFISYGSGKHPSFPWLVFPFLIAFGLLLSGFLAYWRDWSSLEFNFIALTSYSLFAFAGGSLKKFFQFDALPLTRRSLFAYLVLPGLINLAIGYGAGVLGLALLREPGEAFVYSMEDDTFGLRVPLDLWEISWDGKAPILDSPRGEQQESKTLAIVTAGGPKLYKPFTTSNSSSPDFVALQLSRALESYCGESPPTEELRKRYFQMDDRGRTVLKGSTLTVFADYPQLIAQTRSGTFPYIMTLTTLFFFAAMSVYFRFFRASVSESWRKGALIGILAAMLMFHITPFLLFIFNWVDGDAFVAAQKILLRQAVAAFPGASLLIWLACGIILAGAYRLCERQFHKVELPVDVSAISEDA